MKRVLRALAVIAASVALLSTTMVMGDQASAGPSVPAAAAFRLPPPPKILLYGDSITQGTAGLWTWRYRLWQDLRAASTRFNFVGPKRSVWSFKQGDVSSMEYRNPNFDLDHASYAGMTLQWPIWAMANLAAQYRPKVIVGLLGLNDLWRYQALPKTLLAIWRQQIESARRADPGVSIVLAQYGQVWGRLVPRYNAGLAELARRMDRPSSRVVVALAPAFDEHRDTMDGVHLNVSGEILQAQSVAAALARIGMDSAKPPADSPDDGQFTPTPSVTASGTSITASWPDVDYTTCENVYVRDSTADSMTNTYVGGTSFTFTGEAGHTYEIQLAPTQGWSEIGTRSPWVSIALPASSS